MSHESEPEGHKKKEPEPAKKEPEPAKKDQLRNTACHPEALGRKKERVFSPGKGKSGKGERGGGGTGEGIYLVFSVIKFFTDGWHWIRSLHSQNISCCDEKTI